LNCRFQILERRFLILTKAIGGMGNGNLSMPCGRSSKQAALHEKNPAPPRSGTGLLKPVHFLRRFACRFISLGATALTSCRKTTLRLDFNLEAEHIHRPTGIHKFFLAISYQAKRPPRCYGPKSLQFPNDGMGAKPLRQVKSII